MYVGNRHVKLYICHNEDSKGEKIVRLKEIYKGLPKHFKIYWMDWIPLWRSIHLFFALFFFKQRILLIQRNCHSNFISINIVIIFSAAYSKILINQIEFISEFSNRIPKPFPFSNKNSWRFLMSFCSTAYAGDKMCSESAIENVSKC